MHANTFSMQIKKETHQKHEILHAWPAAAKLLQGAYSARTYATYLRELWQQENALHESLAPFASDLAALGFEFPPDRRAAIRTDLNALGDYRAYPKDDQSFSINVAGLAQAVGALYVLTGSYMGGRLIERALQEASSEQSLPINAMQIMLDKGAFARFRNSLNTLPATIDLQLVVEGANSCFDQLSHLLLPDDIRKAAIASFAA